MSDDQTVREDMLEQEQQQQPKHGPLTRAQRDAWCSKLRDPNSVQHFGTMCANGARCVNGWLAEIIAPDEWANVKRNSGPVYEAVNDAIGRDMRNYLQSLNDGNHRTLRQLADYIEANVPITE